jgi:hypothetical protein
MEHLTESEQLPVVDVIKSLSVLYADRARLTPEESQALADAIHMLRTHALPIDHPWGVK